MTKKCTGCLEVQPLSEFNRCRANRDGLQFRCRSCQAQYQRDNRDLINAKTRKWYRENKPQHQEIRVKGRYGISYGEWFEKQDGKCAICSQSCNKKQNLSVDHDHACCPEQRSCGKCVRGLLCDRCNRLLGLVQDSPDLLEQAAEYLEAWQITKDVKQD